MEGSARGHGEAPLEAGVPFHLPALGQDQGAPGEGHRPLHPQEAQLGQVHLDGPPAPGVVDDLGGVLGTGALAGGPVAAVRHAPAVPRPRPHEGVRHPHPEGGFLLGAAQACPQAEEALPGGGVCRRPEAHGEGLFLASPDAQAVGLQAEPGGGGAVFQEGQGHLGFTLEVDGPEDQVEGGLPALGHADLGSEEPQV